MSGEAAGTRPQPSGFCTLLRRAAWVQPDRISREPFPFSERGIGVGAAGAWERDLPDHWILPGLVNAHDHLHLNCFPRLTGAGPFPNSYAWIAACQEAMTTPQVLQAKAVPLPLRLWQGGLKNLLCGVTTVAHHDPHHAVFEEAGFPVRVVRRFGWSHSLGLGLPDTSRSPLTYGPPVPASFFATPPDQPWMIHLAEGTDEIAASELGELDALGCLAANTVLIHAVGLTERDRDRLLERGAGIVWCPTSNRTMLGRTLEPRQLLEAGRLALGTDSRLTGANDLLEEMRQAQRTDIAPAALFALVTAAGSRVLRMPDIGALRPGRRADLLIVRATNSNPHAALLRLRRAEIRAVVRGGLPAIADPDFADWFAAAKIPVTPLLLDGQPKLCATALLGSPGAAELEPGLERVETGPEESGVRA